MLFPHPQRFHQYLANVAGALGVGLLFAYMGLNAASGCGQGGQCIELHDLWASDSMPQQVAQFPPSSR